VLCEGFLEIFDRIVVVLLLQIARPNSTEGFGDKFIVGA
jgi:hypothetical protein